MTMKKMYWLLLCWAMLFSCSSEDNLTSPSGKDDEKQNHTVNPFDNVPSLNEMVVYEVNLKSFSNAGTLDGIKNNLDHIESLGANVIWLMPIYPIGIEKGVGSPYAVRNYKEVNSEFGSLNDLIDLVNEAHERDMAVILDWVANHTAWDNPWISNKSWYAQDGSGNIISPPNTGWADVAELNYDSQDMRDEMIASMKYWVDSAGIDGFRCDAVDFVPEDFWSQAIGAVNNTSSKDLIWLAEGGATHNFDAGFEFNYSWDFYNQIKKVYHENSSASSLFVTSEQEWSAVPAGKTKLRYITNHDVYAWDESPVDIFGKQGSVGAFVATAFMDGIPLIYSGQEVARPELISFFTKDVIDWSENPDILSQYKQVMEVRSEVIDLLDKELTTYTHKDVLIYQRHSGQDALLVMVNTRNNGVNLTLPSTLQNTTWTDMISGETVELGDNYSLDVNAYKILRIGG
ncbi:alpha-amylase family glycosyl hydrolase [Limibacter armeniacum]|uniref:alpha-amylase family glycosyl hydrolase n=1 Tax=Limibacter armeniacum TaxID=466084 RepID=UPI002FE62A17